MLGTLTIAHITDVHLGPIAGFEPRYWNLKRLAGYYNWMRRRREAYQCDVLDRVVADMMRQRPDHIVVTGDLANIGLPLEHINALAWLESLGSPSSVSVVPGNHDIYSWTGSDVGCRRWAAYMRSDVEGAKFVRQAADFPFVRVRGQVALVGVNSAVTTPPLMAWGRVGKEQLAGIAHALEGLGRESLFRVVLIHHPPLPGQTARARGLLDAEALGAVLGRQGAELVLHGHNHLNMLAWGTGPSGRFPVVGAPSGSLGRRHGREPLARYNLYRIAQAIGSIEMVGRGLVEPGGDVVEIDRRTLASTV